MERVLEATRVYLPPDHELAQIRLDSTGNERVLGQYLNSGANRCGNRQCTARIGRGDVLEHTPQVRQGALGMNYSRRGFGRAAFCPLPRRSIQ